jgi:hypothetical protein
MLTALVKPQKCRRQRPAVAAWIGRLDATSKEEGQRAAHRWGAHPNLE